MLSNTCSNVFITRGKLGKKAEGMVRRTTSLGKPSQQASSDGSSEEEECAENEEIYDKFVSSCIGKYIALSKMYSTIKNVHHPDGRT